MPEVPISLLHQTNRPSQCPFRGELEAAARERGASVRLGSGKVVVEIPDGRRVEAFVCGPRAFLDEVSDRLVALGVDDSRIHRERV
jgi:ferredoxin-NADP reductase